MVDIQISARDNGIAMTSTNILALRDRLDVSRVDARRITTYVIGNQAGRDRLDQHLVRNVMRKANLFAVPKLTVSVFGFRACPN